MTGWIPCLPENFETLQELESEGQEVDAFVTNFVYEKEGRSRKKSMSYESVLPVQQIFGWDQVGNFSKGQYIMMHSLIYRTDLLRASQFQLPEHTFYVDNLFVFTPSAGQDHVLSACRFLSLFDWA